MKKILIFQLLFFALFFTLNLHFFPETLKWVEADGFFLTTPDFLHMQLIRPQSITLLMAGFISQFYKWVVCGAFFQALLPTLVLYTTDGILLRLGLRKHLWVSFIPAGMVALKMFAAPLLAWHMLFLLGALLLFLALKKNPVRRLLFLLIAPALYLLLPWTLIAVLYIALALSEWLHFNSGKGMLWMVGGLLLSLASPFVWTSWVSYFPTDVRFGSDPGSLMSLKTAAFTLVAIPAIWLVGRLKLNLVYTGYFLSILLMTGAAGHLKSNALNQEKEGALKLQANANKRSWDAVLQDCTPDQCSQYPAKLPFAMLALSGKGVLPDNLFKYPVNGSASFLFRHNTTPAGCNFNSLFYDCLGVTDEAFHQTFEENQQSDNGACFRCIRRLIDLSLRRNDLALADKYIRVLEHSTCHEGWLNPRKQQLERRQAALRNNTSVQEDSLRSDIFIGGFEFASELARLADANRSNVQLRDYLLCSLLLDKKIAPFASVVALFPELANRPLPQHYAEAMVMLGAANPDLLKKYAISQELVAGYNDFVTLMNQQQLSGLSQKYRRTFWFYYYCINTQPGSSGAAS